MNMKKYEKPAIDTLAITTNDLMGASNDGPGANDAIFGWDDMPYDGQDDDHVIVHRSVWDSN